MESALHDPHHPSQPDDVVNAYTKRVVSDFRKSNKVSKKTLRQAFRQQDVESQEIVNKLLGEFRKQFPGFTMAQARMVADAHRTPRPLPTTEEEHDAVLRQHHEALQQEVLQQHLQDSINDTADGIPAESLFNMNPDGAGGSADDDSAVGVGHGHGDSAADAVDPTDTTGVPLVHHHHHSHHPPAPPHHHHQHHLNDAAMVGTTGTPEMGDQSHGHFTHEEAMILQDEVRMYLVETGMKEVELRRRVWEESRSKFVTKELIPRILARLPNRRPRSIYNYIRRFYHYFDRRGAWTPLERMQLLQLVEEHGQQWAKLSKVLGRMPEDIRDRYRSIVQSRDKKKGRWTAEEDARFQQLLAEHAASHPGEPPNMSLIAQTLGTRSRLQCLVRLRNLDKEAAKARREEYYSRIPPMKAGDRLWIVESLLSDNYTSLEEVDWKKLEREYKIWPDIMIREEVLNLLRTTPAIYETDDIRTKLEYISQDLRQLPESALSRTKTQRLTGNKRDSIVTNDHGMDVGSDAHHRHRNGDFVGGSTGAAAAAAVAAAAAAAANTHHDGRYLMPLSQDYVDSDAEDNIGYDRHDVSGVGGMDYGAAIRR